MARFEVGLKDVEMEGPLEAPGAEGTEGARAAAAGWEQHGLMAGGEQRARSLVAVTAVKSVDFAVEGSVACVEAVWAGAGATVEVPREEGVGSQCLGAAARRAQTVEAPWVLAGWVIPAAASTAEAVVVQEAEVGLDLRMRMVVENQVKRKLRCHRKAFDTVHSAL